MNQRIPHHNDHNPKLSGVAQPRDMNRAIRRVTWAAVIVSVSLVVIKAVAWQITGSVAVLGSLLHSMLDFSFSFVSFFAVRHAMSPADKEHRFGHGKAEALTALGQGVGIVLPASYLIYESVHAFLDPSPIVRGEVGIMVIILSIVMILGLVYAQRRVAESSGSLIITADSTHYKGDLYMSIGVIGALALSSSGFLQKAGAYADPFLGVVVAAILLRNAGRIFISSIEQLMDRELADEDREKIKAIIHAHPDVRNLHDLRTRRSGTQTFIQCHIELDGHLSLLKAHEISDEVEASVIEIFAHADVIIHQDPAGHEAFHGLPEN